MLENKAGVWFMDKITNELEALDYCRENQLKIEFFRQRYLGKEFVVISKGAQQVAGKDFVEAVNRYVEFIKTRPIEHDKLSWFEESQELLKAVR